MLAGLDTASDKVSPDDFSTSAGNDVYPANSKNFPITPKLEVQKRRRKRDKIIRRAIPPIILFIYTFLGGGMFYIIEGQNEEKEIKKNDAYLHDTAQLLCDLTHHQNFSCPSLMKVGLIKIRPNLTRFARYGVDNTTLRHWSYMGAVFFSSTVYTAIGYGNQVPRTILGKYMTMGYAAIGIPFVLNVLAELSKSMLEFFTLVYSSCVHTFLWIFWRSRYKKLHTSSAAESKFHQCCRMPVWFGCFVALVYTVAGSGIFLLIETHWSFFDGFYFCFQTLSTIGFGDITPTSSYYMLLGFGYIIVGLGFLTMCTKVVQRGMRDWTDWALSLFCGTARVGDSGTKARRASGS